MRVGATEHDVGGRDGRQRLDDVAQVHGEVVKEHQQIAVDQGDRATLVGNDHSRSKKRIIDAEARLYCVCQTRPFECRHAGLCPL